MNPELVLDLVSELVVVIKMGFVVILLYEIYLIAQIVSALTRIPFGRGIE